MTITEIKTCTVRNGCSIQWCQCDTVKGMTIEIDWTNNNWFVKYQIKRIWIKLILQWIIDVRQTILDKILRSRISNRLRKNSDQRKSPRTATRYMMTNNLDRILCNKWYVTAHRQTCKNNRIAELIRMICNSYSTCFESQLRFPSAHNY